MKLSQQQCQNQASLLTAEQCQRYLQDLHTDWQQIDNSEQGNALLRRWRFADFATAIAFVNQLAVIAEEQDHHPDVRCGWGYCEVRYTTHSADGITLNDFICASKLDLIDLG